MPVGGGGTRPRCRWAAAGLGWASRRRAEPHISDQAPPVWRAPEGPEGTGGLRGAAPNEVRPPSLAGGRARRRPEHQRRHEQHNNRHHTNAPEHTKNRHPDRMSACGGARGIRTPDLLIANETRYQLRHSPKDSNSLAPSQSAVQADHCRVRHDTERQRKRATRRQRNLDECVTGALHIGRHNSDSLNTRAAQPAQQHPHATAPRARRPAARHQQLRGPLLGASRV